MARSRTRGLLALRDRADSLGGDLVPDRARAVRDRLLPAVHLHRHLAVAEANVELARVEGPGIGTGGQDLAVSQAGALAVGKADPDVGDLGLPKREGLV